MFRTIRRLLTAMIAALLLLAMLPAAADGQTQLQLIFIGMYATSDGSYTARNLSGTFQVYQNGQLVGTIKSDTNGSDPLRLERSGNVQVVPVKGTVASEIPVSEQGYTVSVVEGRMNIAPVVVYVQAGLFRVHTESAASFSLISDNGDTVMSFSTDSKGDYALPIAIPAGQYTLRMENASLAISRWRDKIINVVPYEGPDSVVYVDASYYYYPQITLKPGPTATITPKPTATPTVAPTVAPTVSSVATKEPTVGLENQNEPVVTATPTATPATTPVPTSGTLVLEAIGDGASAQYRVEAGGHVYGQGTLGPDAPAEIADLGQGSYIVTVTLPDDVLLTGLNGNPSLQRRTAQWLVSVAVGDESLYQVELNSSAAVSGRVNGLESSAEVRISGCEVFTIQTADAFRRGGMVPGEYTVTIILPMGSYTGEGWSFVESAGQVLAITRAELRGGEELALSDVERQVPSSISGIVVDDRLKPVQGVTVGLYGADGTLAASAETDVKGEWLVEGLADGEYEVRYEAAASAELDPAQVQITGDVRTAALTARMAAPGSVSGKVMDASGLPAGGVKVFLYRDDSELCASTVTNGQGVWKIDGLSSGEYTVQYDTGTETVIPADGFAITRTKREEVLSAQITAAAALRVQVFVDANNNGSLGKNESMLSGAVISLIRRGETAATAASAVTDANGAALLQAPAGDYVLRCELPEHYGYAKNGGKSGLNINMMDQEVGRVQEAGVTLTLGQEAVFGIGASEMARFSGTVWQDVNCDGLWQAGEPGVAGVLVTADGARNNMHYETTTDENGRFEISQIRNGTYNVSYHVPDGYVFTYKANGAKQLRSLMTTEADRVGKDQVIFDNGDVVDEQNVGLVAEALVEGYCFLDANYNGLFDEGEQPLRGVQVELFRQSNNKRLKTTESDENGYYSFGNVRADTFKLKAILPKDTTYTMNIPGNPEANQFAPGNNRREQAVMNIQGVCGESARVMIGAIRNGSVTGVVYEDSNFSGSWETGEKIVSGISVTLLNASGEPVKSARTNKSGSYTFTDLVPGDYALRMTAKTGYAFTQTGEGSILENIGDGQGESALFRVALGENKTGMSAGLIVPAKVSGSVFADANDNGLQDASERGLAGAKVTLISREGGERAVTVGADGTFLFDAVLPGSYCLRYDLPEGYVFSPVVSGGNRIAGENGSGTGEWFAIGTGESRTADDCGGLSLGCISGTAFTDSNGNGQLNGGEALMPGMTLVLTPSRGDLTAQTVVTGADGRFAFQALRPDEYTLQVVCPSGYVLSRLGYSTLGLAEGETDQTMPLKVSMGREWKDQQLGCVRPATYTGFAWLDENLNGRQDADERPASGEKLTLTDLRDGSDVCTVTTDENGFFTAEGLAPGEYSLRFELADDVRGADLGDSTFREEGGALVMKGLHIQEGDHASGAKLGLVRETTLSGLIWLDSDGATVPVADAQVTLTGSGVEKSVTTGQDGVYTFDGLMPGSYGISVTLPGNLVALEPGDRRVTDGSMVSILAENHANTGRSGEIVVEMAQHQLKLDVGSVLPGRLGDYCWLDLNANGLQDGDEGGIPGVVITLTRNGETVAETVSDQYGYYLFKELYPGEYVLRASWPAEVKPTALRTDLPSIVSVLGENGQSIPVAVDSDGVTYDADLGFVLIDKDHYPAGYGEGAMQIWKFDR